MTTREAWLKERRLGVGASEVAAILGEDPRRGQFAVWESKVNDKPSDEDNSYLRFGRGVERLIADEYMHKTGRALLPKTEYEIVKHPDLPILGATLDFEIQPSFEYPTPAGAVVPGPGEGANVGVLETKAVGFHKRGEWEADPPLAFVIQVQVQMACRSRAWGSLGALMGGIQIAEPVDLLPDPEFMAMVLEAVAKFWWHVENRVPPPADAKPETRAAIRRLWGGEKGTSIALDQPEDLGMVEAWECLKIGKKAVEDQYEGAVNALAVRMGDASTGFLPDGSSFIYSVDPVKAQTCDCGKILKKEHVRRVPRRFWPKGLLKGGKA